MKLPNDLIKATDYSKAKNREIHEFEYRDEKYIHKYVLGGEHELTPQEVIDCLNAISTIDCDLQTAYAYIKGQQDKITDLEAKLAESEKERRKAYQDGFFQKQFEKDVEIVQLEQQLAEHNEYFKSFSCEDFNEFKDFISTFMLTPHEEQTLIQHLKQQLAEKDQAIEGLQEINKNLGQTCNNDAKEIERLREQLAEKEELKLRIKKLDKLYSEALETVDSSFTNQDKISFAVEQLEDLKEKALHFLVQHQDKLNGFYVDVDEIDNQINVLRNDNDGIH